MTRYLVTGGCGFIGANFIRLLRAERPDAEIVNLDLLTYAGNLANLSDLADDPGYRLVKGGIADDSAVAEAFREGVDVVVNFAAESHVDRSILGPREFVTTNVLGTQVLLEQAHAAGVSCFLHVGTDEVYGSLGAEGLFTEQTNLSPRSPYSASKAGADMLVLAYHETFGLPTIVSRCCNNYGPYQFPEKVVPLFVTNLLDGRQVPLYGDGRHVRDWIHVDDHCRALLMLTDSGRSGEIYNIGSRHELTNLDLTHAILEAVGCGKEMIEHVTDRPGHDRRYAIDPSKIINELGWQPRVRFADGLAQTVAWYREHREWWEAIKSGAYRDFYRQWYEERQ